MVTPARMAAPESAATLSASGTPQRPPDGGAGAAAPGERHLLTAIERLARAPDGWAAVALQLSLLPPPGALPYHRRAARALLQDAALRGDGQVFSIRNGDIVLLCRDSPTISTAAADTLRRLFAREGADPLGFVHEWRLPHGSAALLSYAVARIGESQGSIPDDPPPPPATLIDDAVTAIAGARPSDLLRRQMAAAIELAGNGARVTMRVVHRELTFSLESLEGRLSPVSRLAHDAALLLHLGRFLDQRMLRILRLEHGSGSPLDPAADTAVALHINLSLAGIFSDAFTAFAAQVRASGPPLAVEVSLVEALADPSGFAAARDRLKDAGARLVLDGVAHQAFLLAYPATLGADAIKLEWSPRIPGLPAADLSALSRAIAASDPGRLILHRAETEAAVRWGLTQGLRRFQGHHIDQMLAARRMQACPAAGACTLRQCTDRAAATGAEGRAGCANLMLLDAGMPPIGAGP